MAKFGLFMGASTSPSQEYEGDYMIQDGAFVKIFLDDARGDRQVAAINLDKNQSVKQL